MTGPIGSVELVDVHVTGIPVALWAASQEHFAELMREFTLIAGSAAAPRHPIPAQLLDLVEQLTSTYSGFTTEQERALSEAAAAGITSLDLVFRVPRAAGPAAEELERMLTAADEFCRSGDHLLTLATPPECLRYRRWYLAQFIDQAAGKPAVPWPGEAG